jgi:molybdate transport system substrate-binding protein
VATACSEPEEEVSLFAAASLRHAVEDAAEAFEASHPDRRVRVVTAGSQVLRRQIAAGAPASVFVPASLDHARTPDVAARLEEPATLACNRLVVVTPPGSEVRSFEDLPDAERLVLGTPEVPVGAYAEQVLEAAGRRYGDDWQRRITQRIASREIDVRQVLAKVTLGEADAGIVYRTDAIAAGDTVATLEIPDELNVEARYPVAVVRDGPAPEGARILASWLRSDAGFAVLSRHGFERCSSPRSAGADTASVRPGVERRAPGDEETPRRDSPKDRGRGAPALSSPPALLASRNEEEPTRIPHSLEPRVDARSVQARRAP